MIIIFTLFIPSSPRWLLSKDRYEDAVASLGQLRPKEDLAEGRCEAEIQAIREALQEQVHKAPWVELVRGSNLRRTLLVLVYYFFQQVRNVKSHFLRVLTSVWRFRASRPPAKLSSRRTKRPSTRTMATRPRHSHTQ